MDLEKRRSAIKKIIAASGLFVLGKTGFSAMGNTELVSNSKKMKHKKLKGNINHAVCKWCYSDIPLFDFTHIARDLGITGIDLLLPEEWDLVQKQGLKCTLGTDSFVKIESGFNDKGNHKLLISKYKELILKAADNGVSQLIVFSGNKNGKSDEEGWENCAIGLDPLLQLAEKHNILLVMELLNSKVDHKDYQCDRTQWGVALADKLGSSSFKLLYDVYHMQIMEGNVISTIQDYHKYISHYHTAGVPGRHEINDLQELNYKGIVDAICKTGFKGFIAQEFIPTHPNKLASLANAIKICDI